MRLVGQALGDPLGLGVALGREGRVAVPVDERERPAGHHRLGLAVADQEQLGGARAGDGSGLWRYCCSAMGRDATGGRPPCGRAGDPYAVGHGRAG